MGSVQPIPAARETIADRLWKRSQIVCDCAGLGQFAALWDQPDRKAQRGSGFASPEGAVALVSPVSYGVDLAPLEAVAWLGRRCLPQHCPADL